MRLIQRILSIFHEMPSAIFCFRCLAFGELGRIGTLSNIGRRGCEADEHLWISMHIHGYQWLPWIPWYPWTNRNALTSALKLPSLDYVDVLCYSIIF